MNILQKDPDFRENLADLQEASLRIIALFYAGFVADLCLVNIPGAMREMFSKFGYHCIALRNCTTAYEFAGTCTGR
jgi:hypothetical protein